MPNRKDITGQTFNGIYVIEQAGYRPDGKKELMWKCRCHCGKEFVTVGYSLRSGSTRSCKCSWNRSGTDCLYWKGHGEISRTFWNHVKNHSQRPYKNIDFNITIEEAWDLFLKQERKCALTGVDLFFDKRLKDWTKTASLDRIDSEGIYILKNVQWVHKIINEMKNDLHQDAFIFFCSLVADKLEDQTPLYEIRQEHRKYKNNYTGNISGYYKIRVIHNAKSRNMHFDIDWDYVWDLYIKQNGRCAYTGLPIDFSKFSNDQSFTTASLDRIDNNLDYINNNVHWVHKIINKMKWTYKHEEFKNWCRLVTEHQQKKILEAA